MLEKRVVPNRREPRMRTNLRKSDPVFRVLLQQPVQEINEHRRQKRRAPRLLHGSLPEGGLHTRVPASHECR
jgi:hypothetical protein